MKNKMIKILMTATIVLGTTTAMASDLNVVCSVLNQALPGKATLTTGSTIVSGYELTQNAQISSSIAGVLKIKTKEGISLAKLVNVGAGESSTCILAIEDGVQATLVGMDLDKKTFTFEEAAHAVRLVITKK